MAEKIRHQRHDQIVKIIQRCVVSPFTEGLNKISKEKLIEILIQNEKSKEEPIDKMNYAKQTLDFYMKKYNLIQQGWRYEFMNSAKCAGRTYYKPKIIKMSLIYINSPKITKEHIKDTVLHEIAHALVGHVHGHNNVWRAKAIELGCSGSRCCESFSENEHYKHIFACPKGCEIKRMRLTKALVSKLNVSVCRDHKLKFKKIK